MEVHSGFIVGVYNYCDRWCAKCALTSRCRVFADVAMHEARASRELKSVADTPLPPCDDSPRRGWLDEGLNECDQAVTQLLPESAASPDSYDVIGGRARAYCFRATGWLESNGFAEIRDNDDPCAIIQWFAFLISSKVHRALDGLAESDDSDNERSDHDGSAKVALIGIDQSVTAWADMISIGRISAGEAESFVAELEWIRRHVEAILPKARAFIRPGFDEPDELRRLNATDWA